MGLVQRQSFWNTVIAYIGVVIGFANAMYLFPHFLSSDQVGLTRILQQASVIYAQFAALGAPNIFLRFFPFFKHKTKHDGLSLYAFGITTVGVIIVTFLIVVFRSYIQAYYIDNSPLFVNYFIALIPFGVFSTYFNLFEAQARSVYRTIAPSIIKDVLLRLLITLTITLYAIHAVNFNTFLILFVSVNSLVALALLIYLVAKREIHVSPGIHLSRESKVEMIQYGLYSLITGASNMLVITIDSLMIGSMLEFGLNKVAYYTTASFFVALQTMPARSMEKITFPLVATFWRDNDLEKINNLYKKVSITNAIIGSLFFILLWINIYDLYYFLPKEYGAGIMCVFYLGIGRIFDMITGINSIIIQNSRFYRYETLFNIIFAAVAVVLNYILIPIMGINGAALGTTISLIVFNGMKCLFLYFKLDLWPFEWKHAWIILLGALVLISGIYIPLFPTNEILLPHYVASAIHLLNIGIRCLYTMLLFALPIYLIGWSKDINDMADKILNKAI